MIKIPSTINDEDKELIDSIMLTFEDDAKYNALQIYIILQQVTDNELQLINTIITSTLNRKQDKVVSYLSIIRSDIKTNIALIALQKLIPELTLSDIIKQAIHYFARIRSLPVGKQLLITTLFKKT